MDINDWIEKNFEKIKKIILVVGVKIAKFSITAICDRECAICTLEEKSKKCLIPFLKSTRMVKLFLMVIVYGFFYNQLKTAGLEQIVRQQLFDAIASIHEEFSKWKENNCTKKRENE